MFDYEKKCKEILDAKGIDDAMLYLVVTIGISPIEASEIVYSLI